ncbi:hypothetical protein BESB_028670 [Besnoitia besnoiti]|uniref:Uncharacterized protein n=1 Tax=Besnoitia besnoiti TaxID=94643 RepID=A0A2A9M7U4_BESBE|nr:uncharacterized protein BESB_028670 [Besnoitia besnoiti]PFH31432.1 hypothetical protein BESB_028670 [Besnoitia besnoiti]
MSASAKGATSSLFEAIERLSCLRDSDTKDLPRLRILYFTELHGYRLLPYLFTTQVSAVSDSHAEENCTDDADITDEVILEHVFKIYRGLVLLSLRVSSDNFKMPEGLDAYFQGEERRKLLPPLASLRLLDSSAASKSLTWTDAEFQNFFTGQFDLRLDSEPLL